LLTTGLPCPNHFNGQLSACPESFPVATFAVWQCALFGAGAAVFLVLVSLAVSQPRSSISDPSPGSAFSLNRGTFPRERSGSPGLRKARAVQPRARDRRAGYGYIGGCSTVGRLPRRTRRSGEGSQGLPDPHSAQCDHSHPTSREAKVPARPSGFHSRCFVARRRSWWAAGCDTCPGDTVRLVDSYRWCSACARNVKPARGRFDLLFSVTTIACFIALGELLGALIGPFPWHRRSEAYSLSGLGSP